MIDDRIIRIDDPEPSVVADEGPGVVVPSCANCGAADESTCTKAPNEAV